MTYAYSKRNIILLKIQLTVSKSVPSISKITALITFLLGVVCLAPSMVDVETVIFVTTLLQILVLLGLTINENANELLMVPMIRRSRIDKDLAIV